MDKAICRCKQDGPLSLNFNRWLETGMNVAAFFFTTTVEMTRGLNLIFHQLRRQNMGQKEVENTLILEAFLLLAF